MTASSPVATTAADGSQLRQRLAAGARWSLLNSLFGRVGQLLAGMVLARLLTPADYGVYATALVVLTLLLSMNELGVSLAVVRWDSDVRSFGPTVSTIAIGCSTFLYGLAFVASPWIARLLHDPQATTVLRLLSVNVIIDGLVCVNAALLAREFLQGRRMAIDMTNFFVGTGLTILLAALGAGAVSFAWGRLVANLITLVLVTVMVPVRIWPGWDRAYARSLIGYGLPLAAASLLVLAMLNVDYVVVGAVLGPTALGLYMLAFNLSSWPVNFFSEATRRVSFAGFSRLAGDLAALRRAFVSGVNLLTTAALPAAVLLAMLAEPLIRVLYGPQWVTAATTLRFLAALGLARVLFELAYDCLIAVGRRRAVILVQAAWLIALIPVLVVGAKGWGMEGVGLGHVVVALGIVLPLFALSLQRAGIPMTQVARSVRRPVVAGLAMVATLAGVLQTGLRPVGLLAVSGVVGLAVYVAVAVPWSVVLPKVRVRAQALRARTGEV